MSILWLSVALFAVGALEQALSEYQNLISVRLKILQTTVFAEINWFIDFGVSIILFLLLFDFWDGIKAGAMDLKVLLPYLLYIQGCVTGTWLALTVFTKQKQKKEYEKRLQNLEKARQKLKELREASSLTNETPAVPEQEPEEVDEFVE